MSMVRLHYSRALRRAELARSRKFVPEEIPQPGGICYFWRQQKYVAKKKGNASSATSSTRRKVELRRWHGPALMVAVEARAGGDGEPGSCCFLSFRGQLTKCALEHARRASSLEQVAADFWEEAIKEVIDEAAKDRPDLIEAANGVSQEGDATVEPGPEEGHCGNRT